MIKLITLNLNTLQLSSATADRVVVLVLGVLVPSQVHLPLERLVAELAGERLVPGVLAHVRDQVARLAERLQANAALVRFFPCCEREWVT